MAIDAGVVSLSLELNSRDFLREVKQAADKGKKALSDLNREQGTNLSMLNRMVSENKALLRGSRDLSRAEREKLATNQRNLELSRLKVRTAKEQNRIEQQIARTGGVGAEKLRKSLEKSLHTTTKLSRQRIDLDFSNTMRSLNRVEDRISRIRRLGNALGGVAMGAVTFGVGAAVAGIGAAGVGAAGALRLASQDQTFRTQVGVLTGGNQDVANSVVSNVNQFSAQTPFRQGEVQDAARSLLAFQVPAEDLESTLKRVGDVAAGVGAPFGELAEIYGKIKVQGRLFAEDINQLQGRGIPIVSELAKQFGVTEAEIKSMVSEGKIGFEEMDAALKSMTSEGGLFNGMMDELSQTLGGRMSTFLDNLTAGLREFGVAIAPAFEAILDLTGGVLSELDVDLQPIADTAERFADALEDNPELVAEIADLVSNQLNSAIKILSDLYNEFFTWMQESPNLISDISAAFKVVGSIAKVILGIQVAIWKEAAKYVGYVQDVGDLLGGLVFGAIGAVRSEWIKFKTDITLVGDFLRNRFIDAVDKIKVGFEAVGGVVQGIGERISNMFQRAKELMSILPGIGGYSLRPGGSFIGTTGNTGFSTGPHLDVRYADGRRITAADADAYFSVNGRAPSSFGVTSQWGAWESFRSSPHRGIDFATPTGSRLSANRPIADIRYSPNAGGAGNMATITFEDGTVMKVLHMETLGGAGGPSVNPSALGMDASKARQEASQIANEEAEAAKKIRDMEIAQSRLSQDNTLERLAAENPGNDTIQKQVRQQQELNQIYRQYSDMIQDNLDALSKLSPELHAREIEALEKENQFYREQRELEIETFNLRERGILTAEQQAEEEERIAEAMAKQVEAQRGIQDLVSQSQDIRLQRMIDGGNMGQARRYGTSLITSRYEERFGELESQLSSGLISASEYKAARDALIQIRAVDLSNLVDQTTAIRENVQTLGGEMLDVTKGAFQGFFTSVLSGTTSINDAFGTLFSNLANELASLAVSSLFGGLFPAATPGFGGGWLGTALGTLSGIAGFAEGGLVTGPTLAMVGEGGMNEAVVPLPNGRAIPVDMRGGSGSKTVNVTVNNQGPDLNQKAMRQIMNAVDGKITDRMVRETRPDGIIGAR